MNEKMIKSNDLIYCPLCKKSEMQFLYSSFFNRLGYRNYAFALYRCSQCFLVNIYPPASNKIYPASLNKENEHRSPNDCKQSKNFIKKIISYKNAGEFIDLGCNTGHLVASAQSYGFSSMGVEIDEVAANKAMALGYNVINGDFLNMTFPKKFDVIVLNHVLEHIPNLSGVSAKLDEMLADDGVIFINVPHCHGLISKLMRNKWAGLAPFTHIWLYSTESIQIIFKNHFKRIDIETNSASEPHGYCLDFKTNVKTTIIKIANILSMGDEMKVILRKQ